MQAQEVLRQLRIPELDELREYVRGLPTNALMGMGAVAALTTYWFAFRPKAIGPRCDINQQSEELPVGVHFFLKCSWFEMLSCHKLPVRSNECPQARRLLDLFKLSTQSSSITETGMLHNPGWRCSHWWNVPWVLSTNHDCRGWWWCGSSSSTHLVNHKWRCLPVWNLRRKFTSAEELVHVTLRRLPEGRVLCNPLDGKLTKRLANGRDWTHTPRWVRGTAGTRSEKCTFTLCVF